MTLAQGKELKEKNKFDIFMETSAKTGFNVNKLFCTIGKILYEQTMKDNQINKVRKKNK